MGGEWTPTQIGGAVGGALIVLSISWRFGISGLREWRKEQAHHANEKNGTGVHARLERMEQKLDAALRSHDKRLTKLERDTDVVTSQVKDLRNRGPG